MLVVCVSGIITVEGGGEGVLRGMGFLYKGNIYIVFVEEGLKFLFFVVDSIYVYLEYFDIFSVVLFCVGVLLY